MSKPEVSDFVTSLRSTFSDLSVQIIIIKKA